jgi:CheY-like chemotaxis protein
MPASSHPTGLRILVVEDNRDAAASLRMLLLLAGHDARVALTGTDGLRLGKEWAPDAVLCDINLPGLSGFEVAAQLRKHPTTACSRLIAVTAYGDPETHRRAQASGFDCVFTKPADFAALQAVLPARLTDALGPTAPAIDRLDPL